MDMINITLVLDYLNATEIAALQRIVAKAGDCQDRPAALAAIVDAGVQNAGDEYAVETRKVSEFFGG
ncbi:MAG: hypothetical protein IPM39_25925 [Chloroflexi bacterium]|nr:hypothetical protein [Chloroflexota bacterium]